MRRRPGRSLHGHTDTRLQLAGGTTACIAGLGHRRMRVRLSGLSSGLKRRAGLFSGQKGRAPSFCSGPKTHTELRCPNERKAHGDSTAKRDIFEV